MGYLRRHKDPSTPSVFTTIPSVKLANETISNTTHPAPVAEDEPSAKRSKVAVDTPSTDSDQPRTMPALRLGSTAPDFEAKTTQGPIKFHEWLDNSWAILFSHPADKTPVCTTELGEVAKLEQEWKKRGVKTIGLSCDDLGLHEEWIADINELSNVDLKFPIIADADRKVATLYDMLDEQDATNKSASGLPFTVRSVFVIDPAKKIRLTLQYPASTGRAFREILRAIDSLQLGDANRITTPVNWEVGQAVIVHPSVSNEEADKIFGAENVTHLKPYLRMANLKK